MKNISIHDTTLRDGLQAPGFETTVNQKIKILKLLDSLGFNSIEIGVPANPNDFKFINKIPFSNITTPLVLFVRPQKFPDLELAKQIIQKSENISLQLLVMGKLLKIKKALNMNLNQYIKHLDSEIMTALSITKKVSLGVEFGINGDLLVFEKVINLVNKYSIKKVTLADTTGTCSPEDISKIIQYFKNKLSKKVTIGFHGHNDIGLGVANSLFAIRSGAEEIQTTVGGIGERCGNVSIEYFHHLSMALKKDHIITKVKSEKIYSVSKNILKILNYPILSNHSIIGDNAFKTGAGLHMWGHELYHPVNPSIYGLKLTKHYGKYAGTSHNKKK